MKKLLVTGVVTGLLLVGGAAFAQTPTEPYSGIQVLTETITAVAPLTADPAVAVAQLPFTGFETEPALFGGLSLLALGTVLVTLPRLAKARN